VRALCAPHTRHIGAGRDSGSDEDLWRVVAGMVRAIPRVSTDAGMMPATRGAMWEVEMPRRRQELFHRIDEGLAQVERLLGALRGLVVHVPRVPREGGQGYYRNQNDHLREHVDGTLGALLDVRAELHVALTGLREYRDSNSNSTGGRDEARVFVAHKEQVAVALDEQLLELFSWIVGERGDMIERLRAELG
jgi:hypothetical protein